MSPDTEANFETYAGIPVPRSEGSDTDWWHIFNDVRLELISAQGLFPHENGGFPEAKRLAILVEEVGEVATAQLEEGFEELRDELTQVAAMALRWIYHAKLEHEQAEMEAAFPEHQDTTGVHHA